MADTGTCVHDILPPYDEKRRATAGANPVVGQIVRTVVPNLCDGWKIFEAQRADQVKHSSVSGVIRSVDDKVDYRPKATRLPIYSLRLRDSEELLAVRSKLRPCLVLMTAVGILPQHLPNDWQRSMGQVAFRHTSYLVAPIFSIAQKNETKAFGPAMAARIECLVYPQFVYLPRSGGIIRTDSVARLDRAFWATLAPPSEAEQLFLHDERIGVLHNQLLVLQGLPPSKQYVEMADILRLELKSEYEIET